MKKYLLGLMLMFLFSHVCEAVTANSVVTTQTPQTETRQFTSASTVGILTTVYTAGASGSIINSLVATSTDGSAHAVDCGVGQAGVPNNLPGVEVSVPASSGFAAAAPPVNILASWTGARVDSDGNLSITLPIGSVLECAFATPLPTTGIINVSAMGADF